MIRIDDLTTVGRPMARDIFLKFREPRRDSKANRVPPFHMRKAAASDTGIDKGGVDMKSSCTFSAEEELGEGSVDNLYRVIHWVQGKIPLNMVLCKYCEVMQNKV